MKSRYLLMSLVGVCVLGRLDAQCVVQDTQWENIGPTPINYGFGGGWISGVPDPVNSVLPTDPKGIYERYFTPNPGISRIDAVRVGLGGLTDDNGDMTFQVTVYDDDGTGAPGTLVGGLSGISPIDLGVPQGDPADNVYQEFWIDFPVDPTPTTSSFHVGVEIFPGGSEDVLVVTTSCLGPPGCPVAEGESDASNHIFTTGFGYENLQTVYGADFDVNIVPKIIEPASISGFAWIDFNGNGAIDPGPPDDETSVDDLVVYLDMNSNNIKDPGEPESITNQGLYGFHCLAAGNYSVALDTQSIPSGLELTTGMNPTVISLTATQFVENLDFGFMPFFDLSINDVALLEGDSGTSNFDFTVSLTYPSEDTVEVDYTVVADTADAGSDFITTSGTLIFLPSEVEKTLSVEVVGDILYEGDETFQVILSNAVNANIADDTGIGTIIEDDDLIFADGFNID